MDEQTQMYFDEVTPENHIKGFTKSFQKRTKSKKVEDTQVVELLNFVREGSVVFGSKVTEKSLKNGVAKKVFVASNCEDLTLRKIRHYGKIAGTEIVELDLDSDNLAQKLGKPFLISMACVRNNK